MKKTIHDMLDIYALKHHSDDMMLMLRDYVLDSRLSRDDLNDKIVLELGERTPYWSHTELMKVNIENWFATHEDNIKKLVDTLELKYNPLHTTDYTDTEHEHTVNNNKTADTGTIADAGTIRDTGAVSDNGTVKSAGTTSDGYIENTVSAYDSSTYQPQDRSQHHDTTDVTNTTNMTSSTDMTKATNMSKTTDMLRKAELDESRDRTIEHGGKEGNKSYQELIEAERRLAEFNIYDWIVNQLDSEICLGLF